MPTTREFSNLENLTIAQAIYKAVSEAVSTKDPDSLRSRVDAETIEGYERTGCKSYDLMLRGTKVGTYSIRFSKAVNKTLIVVRDPLAFGRWAYANNLAKKQIQLTIDVEDWMPENLVDIEYHITEQTWRDGIAQEKYVVDDDALDVARENGEVPDGCEPQVIDEPSTPIGTLLKVDPALVAAALGDMLSGAVRGLLTEGGEE